MEIKICFDMDGTIADFYGVENWLESILEEDSRPYEIAHPLLNLSSLARILNRLQREGYELAIISWLAKDSTKEYDEKVEIAKKKWLEKHLPSVHWDEIYILPYGTPKEEYATMRDILFDDEEKNRNNWKGCAFDVNDILNTLKTF